MLFECFLLIEEGTEVMQDSAFTRWFSFAVDSSTYIIMEKKSMPEHLQQIDNLDTPVTLQSMVTDMQDLGEVPGLRGK